MRSVRLVAVRCSLLSLALLPHLVSAQAAREPAALARAVKTPTPLPGHSAAVAAPPAVKAPVSRLTTGPAERAAAAPWWAPAASAIVPGAGQVALGQQRGVAYLVAEAYLLLQAVAARRDGDRDRDEYRAIAADVARRPFSDARPTGPWAYYEIMSEELESGRFDRIAGGAVDPETDEATYNGASWRLARETFWSNPNVPPAASSTEYQRALAFYEARAVREEYRWSWRDAQLQRDVYKQTIASANRSFQRSVTLFGLVGANHLTSMIDAYVTVRIRRYGGVRVAGLSLDGIESAVRPLGDPAAGHYRISGALRFVPDGR